MTDRMNIQEIQNVDSVLIEKFTKDGVDQSSLKYGKYLLNFRVKGQGHNHANSYFSTDTL